MSSFTPQQLADWRRYERVRRSGRWNMYDLRARMATGLSEAAYDFVMKHFSELKEAAEKSTSTTTTKQA